MLKSISEIGVANVESFLKTNNLSRKEFAEKAGIAYNQLNQYFAKNPQKIIGDVIARRIEKAFDLEQFWLDQDWQNLTINDTQTIGTNNGTVFKGNQNTQNNYSLKQTVLPSENKDEPPNYLKDMPLLDIDDGVKFALDSHNLDNRILDNAERAATFIPHSGRTFGVKNNKILNDILPTPILIGDILIVEPAIPPRDNDIVLVCLDYDSDKKSGRGVVARLVVAFDGAMAIQANGNATPMPSNSLICGVVVEIKRRLLDNALMKSRLDSEWDILGSLV